MASGAQEPAAELAARPRFQGGLQKKQQQLEEEEEEVGPTSTPQSLTRKRTPLGPYRRPMPRVLGRSLGGGRYLKGVPRS